MSPRGHQAVVEVGWVVLVSQGICSQSVGWLIFHPSDPCVLGLGTWDHTVGDIWGLQVGAVEAQWVL